MSFDHVLRRPAPCNRTVTTSNDTDLPVILDECLRAPVTARGEQRIEIDERGYERLAVMVICDRAFPAIGLSSEANCFSTSAAAVSSVTTTATRPAISVTSISLTGAFIDRFAPYRLP
ncbi:hypothetical protein KPB07_00055 [Burkholderia cenocepacia]|nr:hypothetical protein [Burkholderia cenocepacia]